MPNFNENMPPEPIDEKTRIANDAYAQSLLKVVNQEFSENQAKKPAQKHFLSKKRLIFLAVSTLLSIVLGIVISRVTKTTSSPLDVNQTQELLNKNQ